MASMTIKGTVCAAFQLLHELQKVAIRAENAECPIWQSLKSYAADLNVLVEEQLKVEYITHPI